MSRSETVSETYSSWRDDNGFPHTVQDGMNMREVILEGLDLQTKESIIEYLKANHQVMGLDKDTYTVDLTEWSGDRRKQLIEILEHMCDNCPETWDTSVGECVGSETPDSGRADFDDVPERQETVICHVSKTDCANVFPVQLHPEDELDFEYIKPKPSYLPGPIYQKDELLLVKSMIISEEIQSTIGSAELGDYNRTKSPFAFIARCIIYPLNTMKRLKIRRFFKKHIYVNKWKEERLKKEKAFAIYSTLIHEGPRLGKEFRTSLQNAESLTRTVGTNTASEDLTSLDEYSIKSVYNTVNVGVNAVAEMVEAAVETQNLMVFCKNHLSRDVPEVFSDPEISKCVCQPVNGSSICRCIANCIKSLCDWETVNSDLQHQKVELEELK